MRLALRYLSATLVLLAGSPLPSQQPSAESEVIRSSTHLVVLDVVVKDKHGKPVDNLKREDFSLRDNGQPRKIAMFALDDSRQDAASPLAATGPLTFTNRPALGEARVTAFLFDQLDTKLTDQQLAKQELLHYLRSLPANERVAVFLLGDSLVLLHDYSQDAAALLASLGKHSDRPSTEVDVATAPTPTSNSLTGDAKTTAQWDSFLSSSNRAYIDYTETVRATRTAEALQTIAAHLEGVPGRKTLIWISSGFPVQLGLHSQSSNNSQSGNNRDTSRSVHQRGSGGQSAGGSSRSNSNSSAAPSATDSPVQPAPEPACPSRMMWNAPFAPSTRPT